MEVFVSTAAFSPSAHAGPAILQFEKNEKFEVLEKNDIYRRHRTWWGVRRFRDGRVGYVQATLLQFVEAIPEEALPPNHQAERERQLRELDTMQQEDDPPLPDIYKVPPVQVQSIDDWAAASDEHDKKESTTNGSRNNPPSTRERPSTPDGHYTHSSGDRLFGQKKTKEKKREKVQKSKSDKINEEEATRPVRTKDQRHQLVEEEEQGTDDEHKPHHRHHKSRESRSHKNKKEKESTNLSHRERTTDNEKPHKVHRSSGEISDEREVPLIEESEEKVKEEDAKENKPPGGGDDEEEDEEGFGAHAMPVQDYSDEGNNNHSLSEDEWKKIINDVEDEMNYPDPPEPEVDYPHDDNDENNVPNGSPLLGSPTRIIQAASGSLDDLPKYLKPASSTEDLIEPRKLPNPVISSKMHQDLHREMKHNQKLGIDPLKKKTELKREFERREVIQKRREKEEYEEKKKTEMEKRLQEQKNKYEPVEKPPEKPKEKKEVLGDSGLAEFQRIRSKIYSNIPNQEKS